jgi:hypothetical protein
MCNSHSRTRRRVASPQGVGARRFWESPARGLGVGASALKEKTAPGRSPRCFQVHHFASALKKECPKSVQPARAPGSERKRLRATGGLEAVNRGGAINAQCSRQVPDPPAAARFTNWREPSHRKRLRAEEEDHSAGAPAPTFGSTAFEIRGTSCNSEQRGKPAHRNRLVHHGAGAAIGIALD